MGLIDTINFDTYFHTLPLSQRATDVSTLLAVLANKLCVDFLVTDPSPNTRSCHHPYKGY